MRRKRYFQWIDGEMLGTVSVLDYIEVDGGNSFYVFTDGEVCNAEFISKMTKDPRALIGKAMVEVDSPTNAWRIEKIETRQHKDADGNLVEVPTLEDVLSAEGKSSATIERSSVGRNKWTAPVKEPYCYDELPNPADYPSPDSAIVEQKPVAEKKSVPVVEQKPVVVEKKDVPVVVNPDLVSEPAIVYPLSGNLTKDASDPVCILVKKCKKHETDVNLTLTINLPSKSTFEFASSEFECGAEKFISYVLSDLKLDLVIDSLKTALFAAYQSSPEKDEDK